MYPDDILIFTEMIKEHLKLVHQVLKKLLVPNLYAKCIHVSKCEFHKTYLDYLGYRVSTEVMEMDPGKVKAILNWQPAPTNP